MSNVETMFKQYVETALWASTDLDGKDDTPLDENHDSSDLSDEAKERMYREVKAFYDANENDILVDDNHDHWLKLAGHDLWLTRNGHGSGFWDGDWPEPQAARLTELATKLGEQYLFCTDDGKIEIN